MCKNVLASKPSMYRPKFKMKVPAGGLEVSQDRGTPPPRAGQDWGTPNSGQDRGTPPPPGRTGLGYPPNQDRNGVPPLPPGTRVPPTPEIEQQSECYAVGVMSHVVSHGGLSCFAIIILHEKLNLISAVVKKGGHTMGW